MLLSSVRAVRILCVLTLVIVCAGCAGKREYQAAVAANRGKVQHLELGMSGSAVASVMGVGDLVTYRRIRLANPWRSEAFILQDDAGTPVKILYYLTEPQRNWRTAADQELTPVVLENDHVVGWGWSYLRRNTDRYAISTPHEQR